MLNFVQLDRRVQWSTFTVQDQFRTTFNIPTNAATVGEKMIALILGEKTWTGARRLNATGIYEIGYGIGDVDDEQGHTESQSYSEWVGDLRNRQKTLRAQLPVISLPASVFDGLLSLYMDTGKWRNVQADEGVYDVASAVKNGNWLSVANMIARGNVNPILRKKEASVIQLAAYGSPKDRNQQIIQGVQTIRTRYVDGIPLEFDKKQAEFAYYRQFQIFLPGMSQLRQRRIVAQART
jgi:hypothetical protein